MLKVTVELHPFGRKSGATILNTLEIWNDGSGSPQSGNYSYRLMSHGHNTAAAGLRHGELSDFPRQEKDVLELVLAVLQQEFGREDSP